MPDYQEGRGTNDGLTRQSPWKQHPWDRQASGQAKQCQGIHTYVFKRGVIYRGMLRAGESGRPGHPIRLTSDPTWGRGMAVISGAGRVTGPWKRGAENPDIPHPDRVWTTDLEFAPRTVYLVEPSAAFPSEDDKITRIPLARMPNWTMLDPEDVKSQWWYWDNPGHPYFPRSGTPTSALR